MNMTCNECEFSYKIDAPIVGEKLNCPECGISLKVLSLNNQKVDTEIIEEELEDWGE